MNPKFARAWRFNTDNYKDPRPPEASRLKFSPYISPLKNFKAYRYHPVYTDDARRATVLEPIATTLIR